MPLYIEKSGNLVGCYHSGTDRQTNKWTRKDRATQPMDHGRLRWAIPKIIAHGPGGGSRLQLCQSLRTVRKGFPCWFVDWVFGGVDIYFTNWRKHFHKYFVEVPHMHGLWARGHNFRRLWINPSSRVTLKIGRRSRIWASKASSPYYTYPWLQAFSKDLGKEHPAP